MDTRGHELTTVVQLAISDEVAVATTGLAYERCSSCERVKYAPVTRGPSPTLTERPSRAMAKTREYFGSGGQADKRLIVSQQLARARARS